MFELSFVVRDPKLTSLRDIREVTLKYQKGILHD